MLRSRVVRLLMTGAAFAAYLAFGWYPAVPSVKSPAASHAAGSPEMQDRQESGRGSDSAQLSPVRPSRDLLINFFGFMPLGGLLAILWPGLGMRRAGWLCAVLSFLIETGQLVLPGHYPSIVDLTLNTLGGALGWRLATLLFNLAAFRRAPENPEIPA